MQHEHHRVPVTALAFWKDNVILAGEGTFLKAYDVDRKTLLASLEVFEGQAIHGIVVARHHSDEVAVWGGQYLRFIRLISRVDGLLELQAGSTFDAEDWILDAAFSDHDEELSRTALVTAHNALLSITTGKEPAGQVELLVPGSNCILYCAHVRWLSGSQCLIASGTAFGDVIVWSCLIQEAAGKMFVEHQTHYTFAAHEGSVFGVQTSSSALAESLGCRNRILATCSDDRTIRLWDISDLSVTSPTLAEQQRQTGFGSTESVDAHAPPALAKVMGHISRIWHVRLRSDAVTGKVYVLSFGEDASNITWSVDAKARKTDDLPYSLRQVEMQRNHNGKHIWSLAIKECEIFTGGADGALSLQHVLVESSIYNESSTGLDNDSEIGHEIGTFRAYGFVDASELVASDEKGNVHLVKVGQQDVCHSKILDAVPGLRGYSVMANLEGIAFFAGSDGEVYMYRSKHHTANVVARTGRKVAGLFAQRLPMDRGKICLLITNMGRSVATLYWTEEPDGSNGPGDGDGHALQVPSGFVTTSFVYIETKARKLAIIGSRNGSIALFENMHDKFRLVLEYPGAHAGETVTKLHAAADDLDEDKIYLLSTGRDGTCAVHRISLTDVQPTVTTVHQLSLPFGPNIEGLGFNPDGHLWVWGFRSTQFVLFDIKTQQEVMKVECGGAHRIWSFQPAANGGNFVWTKASKLHHQIQARPLCEMINAGSHGREIKCVAVSPDDSHLIATGAEDTDIKLSVYNKGKFRLLHTLQKHNTGIQHLQWSSDGQYLFSSGGFEEFHVWKITQNVPHIGIGVVCESKHPRSGASDLRIMSFDVRKDANDAFHITTAYSDSTLKSWSYTPSTRTWILLAKGDHLTSCLTQCIHLETTSNTSSIVTASTDGHIAVWSPSTIADHGVTALRWIKRHRIHQNAILALQPSCNLPDQSRLLITGGDDNAIGITRFAVTCASPETLLISRAHVAAVTALAVVHVDDTKDVVVIWLVSASIDQRVKLWKIEIDVEKEGMEGVRVKLVQNEFTAVADVSSMEVLSGKGVLVCGVGLDVWKIDESGLR